MASKPGRHKVVVVATGTWKTDSIFTALRSGLANTIVTGADVAEELVKKHAIEVESIEAAV